MKIPKSSQFREADQFTILSEPISSTDLMERAGHRLFEKITNRFSTYSSFVIFCGPGNNGGDGLVLALYFHNANKNAALIILKGNYTDEFLYHFQKIKELGIKYIEIENLEHIHELNFVTGDVFIDALFGTGLSRPIGGLASQLIQKINSTSNFKIAIDIPSGLSPDASFASTALNTVLANYTLSIQLPKFAFFFDENYQFTGEFDLVDIGLSKSFIEGLNTTNTYTLEEDIAPLIKHRPINGHKGNFGHALIIAGSEGKSGAALLTTKAALRTGCGLVSAAVPPHIVDPLLTFLPEATSINREDKEKIRDLNYSKFKAVGFGPGVGFEKQSSELLFRLLKTYKDPLIIDADGLTILSGKPKKYKLLHPGILLTPHPGEFDRLTKLHTSRKERFKTQQEFSKKYNVNILLKGRYTSITTPHGKAFFNSTGNSGMATAGSGDVLTGIITSLCAQGYTIETAAVLGAFLHGYAGDMAALNLSQAGMIASDIIDYIPVFFKHFEPI